MLKEAHMADRTYTITYPRKRIARGVLRLLGRLVLPAAFRIDIVGQDNFPMRGPLLVVGNHVAVMEAVLMTVFTPWQVELLGARDIPHERVTEIAIRLYGFIPLHRGHMDRPALTKAVEVLEQGGVIGIFPEGGIWDAGAMRAQTGVAWLSYRANTPVLPIGFSGTLGALGAAFRLQRPALQMRIGQPIPAASPPAGQARKAYLQEYATQVVAAIKALLPPDDPSHRVRVVDERFELRVAAQGPDGSPESYSDGLAIRHATALAKLLHRPAVLKIFKVNLRLPIDPLQDLQHQHDAGAIVTAVEAILGYLRDENPYLLTYRFGPREAEEMEFGLQELLALARWAAGSGFSLVVTPIRRYFSPERGEEVVQIEQGEFRHWR
jgi:1-acyl-sn-glycerol-3-phosphate acyltransferase